VGRGGSADETKESKSESWKRRAVIYPDCERTRAEASVLNTEDDEEVLGMFIIHQWQRQALAVLLASELSSTGNLP